MEKQFEKPMKWYKFVIYFQLFAAAVFNVGAGIIFLQVRTMGWTVLN